MRFANAQLLWLLLAVPLLIAFLRWAWRQRRRLVTQFIHSRLLAGLMAGVSLTRRKIRCGLIVLAVTLSLIALARPQWGFDWEEVKQRGLDVVVAIDTSRSMLAEDAKPDRLTKAKYAALDLMQQAKSDRLGLVAFAGTAFLQCPLTVDDEAFRQSINALDVNIIPQGGTALAGAIETALAAFKDEADNYKVLVIFTDGEDHDSAALEAAGKAAKAGLRIFTIGIGTADGELLRLRDEKGNLDYLKDDQGNVVKSRLNESLLQQIAGATDGGFYLPLRGANTIDTLYERGLAPLPKSDLTTKHVRRYRERFRWPLAAAILLLLAELFLPERKRKSQPAAGAASAAASAKTAFREAVAVSVFLVFPAALLASPSSALRQYEAGKYEDALKEYQQLLRRKADDPRLHFNAGAAAYQNKQYDEAAKEFNETLSAKDLNIQQRSYYNLGNTLYQIGENIPDPTKKTEAWENSVKSFDAALKLNPQDADARFNYEFVKKKLEELKQQQQQQSKPNDVQPSEDAKKAKAAADEAVRRRDYRRALEIMENQLRRDSTTSHYSDYIQRLKEISDVKNVPNR